MIDYQPKVERALARGIPLVSVAWVDACLAEGCRLPFGSFKLDRDRFAAALPPRPSAPAAPTPAPLSELLLADTGVHPQATATASDTTTSQQPPMARAADATPAPSPGGTKAGGDASVPTPKDAKPHAFRSPQRGPTPFPAAAARLRSPPLPAASPGAPPVSPVQLPPAPRMAEGVGTVGSSAHPPTALPTSPRQANKREPPPVLKSPPQGLVAKRPPPLVSPPPRLRSPPCNVASVHGDGTLAKAETAPAKAASQPLQASTRPAASLLDDDNSPSTQPGRSPRAPAVPLGLPAVVIDDDNTMAVSPQAQQPSVAAARPLPTSPGASLHAARTAALPTGAAAAAPVPAKLNVNIILDDDNTPPPEAVEDATTEEEQASPEGRIRDRRFGVKGTGTPKATIPHKVGQRSFCASGADRAAASGAS